MPIADAPLSNKQHAVPQNIMDVEFKLIGDLTMRQFSYLLVFGILAYVSFNVVIGIFKVPIGLLCILLGLGLAFVPIGERGMDDWIASFIRAINSPTQRIWKKEIEIPLAFTYRSLDVVKQELITLAPTSSRRKLEEYLKYQVNTDKGDPLDIPEQEYINKVRSAFAFTSAPEPEYLPTPTPSVGVSVIDDFEEISQGNVEIIPDVPSVKKEEEQPKISEQPKQPEINLPVEPMQPQTQEQKPVSPSPAVSEQPKIVARVAPPVPKAPRHLLQAEDLIEHDDQNSGMLSMTPDMHSGRRFTNLLPSSGELILPIKGERVLRTSDQVRVEDDIKEKTERLQKLLLRIKEKENIAPSEAAPKLREVEKPVVIEVAKEAENVVKNLQDQNDKLNKDIEDLRNTIQKEKSMSLETSTQEEKLKNLVEQKEKLTSSYAELGKKYEELQKELEARKKADVSSEAVQYSSRSASPIPTLTKDPNIITGIVKDSTGKLLPNVLLLVKNKKNEAVRAFKTNTMGQFVLLTPMDNGVYTVEVSSSNELTESFAIIPVEVKGEVIPPMEFVGKA